MTNDSESDVPARLETQIRNPRPVVARLVKTPGLLGANSTERRRALLILHTLVRLAEGRGWSVDWASAADKQYKKTSTRDLMAIDAGHRPVTIRVRMKQVRVAHVPTESEKRWGYGRQWDYTPGEAMRLEVRDDYRTTYFDDGKRKRVEDHLHRVLNSIKKYSDQQVERDAKRLEQLREAEDKQLAWERQRVRVDHYRQWSDALYQLLSDVDVHEMRTRTLDRLERDLDGHLPNPTFLEWARRHLHESDPLRTPQFPLGPMPEMTLAEFRAATSHV